MCNLCPSKPVNHTGRLYKVIVLFQGALVGWGYAVVDNYDGAHEPIIQDILGNILNPTQYDEVHVSNEKPKWVIVNRSKH